MRIAFFDSKAEELTPQRKGHLFESLARRLVKLSGYGEVQLRVKHASLEYDLEARHEITGRVLVGEAKAHLSSIRGQEISAFVGKLLPRAARENVDGLFISTSSLTAEARDYLTDLAEASLQQYAPGIQTLIGDEIPRLLSRQEQCISETFLREHIANSYNFAAIDTWFVAADLGDFLVATCGPNVIGSATHFAAFSLDGRQLTLDKPTLHQLHNQLSDLEGLQLLFESAASEVAQPSKRLPSIAAGTGWFDYKFPADPAFFIGRNESLADIEQVIDSIHQGSTAVRAIQLTSRSGVGKSSVLLKAPALTPSSVVTTVDSRAIRVPTDMRLLVSDLVERTNTKIGCSIPLPKSQEEMQDSLHTVGGELARASSVAIVQMDQFESVLARPRLFETVLDLIATCTTRKLPIVWLLARKNDVAVTFDESASIDLARLNDYSRSIRLTDFDPSESQTLLDRLSRELSEYLQDDLAELILTFSAGFPWLLKRLCAHVISMHTSGISQRDLVQAGLRAEDLFEEDLAGLNEQDKALLRTVAAHLPNTAAELARRLESEVSTQQLTSKLNEFLGQRLLRLSGDVYDTYNDVFKTYLITQRIPFQSRYVFRVTPGATFDLLKQVENIGPTSLSSFQEYVGGNPIGIINKLRELRLLGLIDRKPGWVALTPETRTAIESDTLGDFVRKSLRANGLVVRVLDLLSTGRSVSLSEVVQELKREMPHVTVASGMWEQYARLLVAWLRFASLAFVEGEQVRLREVPSDKFSRRREFTRGTFSPDVFMPSVRPGRVLDLLLMLRDGTESKRALRSHFGIRKAAGLLRDAEILSIAAVDDKQVRLGLQGKVLLDRDNPVTERDIAELALTKPNIQALIEATQRRRLDEVAQRALLEEFGSVDWTNQTWRWRLGLLRSWLVATQQVKSGRRGLEAVDFHDGQGILKLEY